MDKQRMTFDIDRRTITEGDIVEISWQCEGADSVSLTLNNGFKTNEIALEISGTKRFRLNRSKGRTKLTLTVTIQGKKHQKTIHVKVKKMPTFKTETIDNNGKYRRAMPRLYKILNQLWQKIMSKWRGTTSKINLTLQSLPLKKQIAVKLLALISVMLIISFIWPRFYTFALTLLSLYLIVTLIRK